MFDARDRPSQIRIWPISGRYLLEWRSGWTLFVTRRADFAGFVAPNLTNLRAAGLLLNEL